MYLLEHAIKSIYPDNIGVPNSKWIYTHSILNLCFLFRSETNVVYCYVYVLRKTSLNR